MYYYKNYVVFKIKKGFITITESIIRSGGNDTLEDALKTLKEILDEDEPELNTHYEIRECYSSSKTRFPYNDNEIIL